MTLQNYVIRNIIHKSNSEFKEHTNRVEFKKENCSRGQWGEDLTVFQKYRQHTNVLHLLKKKRNLHNTALTFLFDIIFRKNKKNNAMLWKIFVTKKTGRGGGRCDV